MNCLSARVSRFSEPPLPLKATSGHEAFYVLREPGFAHRVRDRFWRDAVLRELRDLKNREPTSWVHEERRKHHHYRMGFPVIFSWQDARQAPHEGVGLTRDVSLTGGFVLTVKPPPLQAKIRLEMFFPPVVGAAGPLRFHGDGRVVRVEAIEQGGFPAGFAVSGKPFALRRGVIGQ